MKNRQTRGGQCCESTGKDREYVRPVAFKTNRSFGVCRVNPTWTISNRENGR